MMHKISFGLSFLLALGCAACGDDAPTQTATESVDVKAKVVKKAASDFSNASVWRYSSVGKRDPFRSYLADLKESKTIKRSRRLEETEQFDLNQYRLTGLITGTSQPKAMVEDPDGNGHVLRLGSRLGRNGGRITKISSLGMVVLEEYRDPTGKKVRVPLKILLPDGDIP